MNTKNMMNSFITITLSLLLSFNASAASTMYFVHSDHLGTPQMLTDEDQDVVWQMESQTPFGVAEVNEDPDGDGNDVVFNLRFPGQYYDKETNTNYNYFRNYDPSLGRYLQSDPIGLNGGINTYAYVMGNPLRYSDRLGLTPEGQNIGGAIGCAIGGGIGATIGGVGGGVAGLSCGPGAVACSPSAGAAGWIAGGAAGCAGGGAIGGLIGDLISNVYNEEADDDQCSDDDVEWVDPNDLTPTEPLSDLDTDVVEDILEDILENGFDPNHPLDVHENNRGDLEVYDGHHRLRACIRAGICKIPVRR